MPGDYGYANARLRAMASRLLSMAEYEALIARESIAAFLFALTTTDYKEAIEASLLRAGGIQSVFEAMRLNFTKTFRDIRGFFEAGEPQELVDVLVSRWDLHNVRTIVRGQAAHTAVSDILETVIPAGELDGVALEAMAQQPGLQAMVDLMLTQRLPYSHALAVALQTSPSHKDRATLELALERHYYAAVFARLDRRSSNASLVRHMVQTEIDCTNLATFLRLHHAASEGSREPATTSSLIEGGTLSRRRWEQLASAKTTSEVAAGLEGTAYRQIVEAGLQEDTAAVYRHLERYLFQQGINMWHGDPLSIATVIGYMWAKNAEVRNLRLIAYAVAGELPREAVREDLIPWRN